MGERIDVGDVLVRVEMGVLVLALVVPYRSVVT